MRKLTEILHRRTWHWGQQTVERRRSVESRHSSAIGGHEGMKGSYQRAKQQFYWPRMKTELSTQFRQKLRHLPAKQEWENSSSRVITLPMPSHAWSHITMDFIEGLPKSDWKDVVLVVVDRKTKYAHFRPWNHPYTAVLVTRVFYPKSVFNKIRLVSFRLIIEGF